MNLSTEGLGLGLGVGATVAIGDVADVDAVDAAPGLVDKVLTGRSRTRSGVCFCRIVTLCSQKSRFERNPPRTAWPPSSLASSLVAVDTFCCDERRSHKLRFLAKSPPFEVAPRLDVEVRRGALASLSSHATSSPGATICSRDAQLDCLKRTFSSIGSDFVSSDRIVRGVGVGCVGVADSPPDETLRDVGFGAAIGGELVGDVLDGFGRSSTPPVSELGDDFCFSRCSAMASTSAMVDCS